MSPANLVVREIMHRRVSFVLGTLAIAVSVVCLVGALAVLESFDRATDKQLGEMNAETENILKAHEDEIRKAMKGLGFNIHIYPDAQDLAEIYSKGYGLETMPESYVRKLADSDIVTVNHLLPRLTQMVEWPEGDTSVLLFGVRGEEPIAFRGANKKGELIDPVAKGEIALGYELHHRRKIMAGDSIVFRGRKFNVAKTHERRGGIDDITVWASLSVVQEMLGKPGKINSILALECNCESLDRLGEVVSEIKSILPNTQIIEVESKALARAQARNGAKSLRLRDKEKFLEDRENLRATREGFANVMVILVTSLSLIWIAYLTASNVRERIMEIGTLSAIGVGFSKLLQVILSRAILMGICGTSLALAFLALSGKLIWEIDVFELVALGGYGWFGLIMSVPLLSCAAAWLPAFAGAQRAPAEILRND
ncbi:MAG: ABC transporter permease [Verrucomicrobiales bacterium]